VQRGLGVHIKYRYGLELEWHAGNTTRRRTEVKYADLAALQSAVIDTKTRQTLVTSGLLRAVDDDKKTFKFRTDAGDDVEGRYADGVIQEEHAASVPARYMATILTVTDIVSTGGKKPKPVISLEKLEVL
jgi:hypothetical protein